MKSNKENGETVSETETTPLQPTTDDPFPPLNTNPLIDSLPTQEQLTSFAAIVANGTDTNPQQAVEYAFLLWKAASAKLLQEEESAQSEYKQLGQRVHDETCGGALDYPESFPASYEQFLKLVVVGKTPADRTKRIRDFLIKKHHDNEGRAINALKEMKEVGFPTEKQWLASGEAYLRWWKDQISQQNSKSARQRKKLK